MMRKSLTKIDLTGAQRSIARHTVEVGECLEWTAYSRGATPQMRVSLGDGTSAGMYVRRVQWTLSRGTDPGKLLITTRCGNPRCVRPEHLKAISMTENGRRCAKRENGTLRRSLCIQAAAQRNAKLTPEAVREIKDSSEPGTAIAARLGVHQSTVNNVRRGRTWRESGPFAQMVRFST